MGITIIKKVFITNSSLYSLEKSKNHIINNKIYVLYILFF